MADKPRFPPKWAPKSTHSYILIRAMLFWYSMLTEKWTKKKKENEIIAKKNLNKIKNVHLSEGKG